MNPLHEPIRHYHPSGHRAAPRLPASVPIVIWGLDNACFRALSPLREISTASSRAKTTTSFMCLGTLRWHRTSS